MAPLIRVMIGFLLLLFAIIPDYECQVISYGMRKLALSMNQFGLDMLRTMDRMSTNGSTSSSSNSSGSFVFCPFCVGSSLAMLLAGLEQSQPQPQLPTSTSGGFTSSTKSTPYDTLRYTLYLSQMQPQEIHLAFYDLAQHLQSNIPEGFRAKRSVVLEAPKVLKIHRNVPEINQNLPKIHKNVPEVHRRAKRESVAEDDLYDDDIGELADDAHDYNGSDDDLEDDDKQLSNIEGNIDDSFDNDYIDGEESARSMTYVKPRNFPANQNHIPNQNINQNPNPEISQKLSSSSPGSGLLIPPEMYPPVHQHSSTSSSTLMHFINQIYTQRYLPVDYNYYVLMQYYYKTPIRTLDFAYAGEESRQHINAVVEQLSHDKIKGILKESTKPEVWLSTRLLLLSALYFEGKLDFRDQVMHRRSRARAWKNSKRPTQALASMMMSTNVSTPPPSVSSSSTTTGTNKPNPPMKQFDPFKPLGPEVPIKTKESIRLRHSFSSYLNATIVEMPFTGGIISLVALVPLTPGPRGVETMLSRLNAQLIVDLVQHLEIRRIDITMPVLNLTHSIPNWDQLFAQMGLSTVFGDPSTESESDNPESSYQTFAGMKSFPLAQVTQLQHKTVLDIGFEEDPKESVPKPKKSPRPKKSLLSSNANTTRIIKITKRSPVRYRPPMEPNLVQSQILQIIPQQDPLLPSQSRPSPVNYLTQSNPNPSNLTPSNPTPQNNPTQPKTTRIHVSLEEEFVYLILDQISGLILSMGKYKVPRG